MRRQRTQSNYQSVRHNSKPHCPQDLSCRQCCQCMDRLTKQNKILQQKNWILNKQRQTMMKQIMRLNKVIKGWQKRQRELKDLEQVKRRLKADIKAQYDEQHRVDKLITDQKISSLKKDKENLNKERKQLLDKIDNYSHRFDEATAQIKKLQLNLDKLQQQHTSLIKETQEKVKTIKDNNNQIEELHKNLDKKTGIIDQLEKALTKAEQNYLQERSKYSDAQFELTKIKEEVKNAARSIENLKKDTKNKQASIQQLTSQNNKLDKLVQNLDSTIASYTVLEKQLRHRVLATQEYALQKELEVKQVEADFYDVVYRRSI